MRRNAILSFFPNAAASCCGIFLSGEGRAHGLSAAAPHKVSSAKRVSAEATRAQYAFGHSSLHVMHSSCHVFTYGSLMFASVWRRVVRGHCQSVKAVLAGHARFAIDGESYPGIMARTGTSVEGVLYLEADADDVMRLDAFEGSDYRRTAVRVQLPDGSQTAAQTYLYNFPHRFLSAAWHAEEFNIRRFLETYCPNN
jgi:gamma-glutamylcyclotransferase (GGCT)/AIG2-like uncharacterized protein YtfP